VTITIVDWTAALNAATKLVRPGPEISREDAAAVVAELGDCVRPRGHWHGSRRPRWIQANLDGFRQIVSPLNARVSERLKQSSPTIANNLGPRITRMEVGALLGYLSSKVLGQFGLLSRPDPKAPGGRLLLVAPNIVSNVDPGDFRPWVCLHDVTQRVQFAAVRWLRGHLISMTRSLGLLTLRSSTRSLRRHGEDVSAGP
jgi:putative hydrolase